MNYSAKESYTIEQQEAKILLRRFVPPSKTGAKPLQNCEYP
jgi:hypothetical protein